MVDYIASSYDVVHAIYPAGPARFSTGWQALSICMVSEHFGLCRVGYGDPEMRDPGFGYYYPDPDEVLLPGSML